MIKEKHKKYIKRDKQLTETKFKGFLENVFLAHKELCLPKD